MVELKCPKCSAPLAEGSRYCTNCGEKTDPGATGSRRLSDSGALELRNLLYEQTRDEYRIEEELGRGGMAVVFRAWEVHLNRSVAIKVLPPDLTFARGSTERFQREARTAAALDHPNIIPIYRIAAGGRLFWYAMKFLEGRSLAQLLESEGQLSLNQAAAILDQVADALDYAHQRNVIHRDIKPGNIMIDARGRVTVTDFGIAKELSGGALTGSGAILGTPYYMSPEQCRGGKLTGAADQYSLGVVTYQMIAGKLPFEADSAIDVLHKHVTEPPPPLDSVLPGLAKHVTNAVGRAMAKKPEDRFPSVTAFVRALKGDEGEDTLVIHRRSLQQRLAAAARLGGVSRLAAAGRVAVGVLAVGALVAASVWLTARAGGQPEGAFGGAGPDSAPRIGAPAGAIIADSGAVAAAPLADTAASAPRPAAGEAAPAERAASRRPAAPPPAGGAAEGDAARPATPAAGRMGFLRIIVTPAYATITVNGASREGRGWADSIAAGSHTVTVAREGWEVVGGGATRQVRVAAGREQVVTFQIRQRSQP